MDEGSIQEHVVHLMRSYGRPEVCYFAVANGEKRSISTGARLKRQGVVPGAPDIVLCIDGVFHGLELKVERGRLSEMQIVFRAWLEVAGGHYHVAYGMDAAFQILQHIGALKPNLKLVFKDKEWLSL